MAQPVSPAGVLITDFAGLVSNSGPEADRDSPGAARDQVNLTCPHRGELRVRPGTRPVVYDTEHYVPPPGSISSILPAL